MLSSTPPGLSPNSINRQLPQQLSIPGSQSAPFSGGRNQPQTPYPASGSPMLQPSGLQGQPTTPALLGSGGAPGMGAPSMGGAPGIGGAPGTSAPPGGGAPGMLGSPPPGGAPPASPMSMMPPQNAMPQSAMSSPMGAGMHPGVSPQAQSSGLMDPQVQSMVQALAKPGTATPTY